MFHQFIYYCYSPFTTLFFQSRTLRIFINNREFHDSILLLLINMIHMHHAMLNNANQLAANTDEGYSYSRYFIPNGEHSKKQMPIQRTDKIKF